MSEFPAYPAEELLIDLLRANLKGALEFESASHHTTVYFREGVPISAGPDPELARGALVALVAGGRGGFSFVEGRGPPPGSTRTVLRTLSILFSGLSEPQARPRVEAFLAAHEGRRIRLNDTYPRDADPFGFPPALRGKLAELDGPISPSEVSNALGSPEGFGSALYALFLAKMLSFEGGDAGVALLSAEPDLMLHEEAAPAASGSSMPNSEVPVRPSSSVQSPLKVERAEIARVVDPLRGKDYLEILRVTPETKPDQIDRSRHYLAKQLAKGDGPGTEAVRDLLDEAFEILTCATRGPEYRKLAKNATTQKTLRKRQAFEARPKLQRVAAKLAQGQFAQAAYLIDWAAALDPDARDVSGHRSFLEFCLQTGPAKPEFALGLRLPMEQLVEAHPKDLSLKLYLVVLYVAMGEKERAPALFASLKDADAHPFYALAQVAVAALG